MLFKSGDFYRHKKKRKETLRMNNEAVATRVDEFKICLWKVVKNNFE